MNRRLFLATFEDEEHAVSALEELRSNGVPIMDVYAPYASHELESAAGISRSRLGWVCAIAGLTAAVSMLFFQYWTSAVAWPINVGGKPMNSLPAFVPIMFEIGVLAGGLSTVAAFLIRSRLYPGKKPVIPDPRVTDDRFVVVLEEADGGFPLDLVRATCLANSAVEMREALEGVDL